MERLHQRVTSALNLLLGESDPPSLPARQRKHGRVAAVGSRKIKLRLASAIQHSDSEKTS